MTNLIKDLSALTNVSEKILNKMVELTMYSINDSVKESVIKKDNYVDIDVGIGTLTIKIEDNDLKFKFIPSAKLRESVISTIKNEDNTLDVVLENSIATRFIKLYKEVF